MVQCRVLIVSDQCLFAEGIRSLIEEAHGLEVVDIVSEGGDVLTTQVRRSRPDVIILDDTAGAQVGFLSQLFDVAPGVRIILMGLDDSMEIYDRRKVVARRGQDLVDVVRCVNDYDRS